MDRWHKLQGVFTLLQGQHIEKELELLLSPLQYEVVSHPLIHISFDSDADFFHMRLQFDEIHGAWFEPEGLTYIPTRSFASRIEHALESYSGRTNRSEFVFLMIGFEREIDRDMFMNKSNGSLNPP
ncbi:hypothetical protein GAY31_28690 [Azospirillum brasilense]|nr:hypothetical protein [Azospirillum brasilense]